MLRPARWTTLIAALLIASSASGATTTTGTAPKEGPAPKVARYSIKTQTYFSPIPANLSTLDFWIAAPLTDAHQKTFQFVIFSGYSATTYDLVDPGTLVAHMTGGPRGGVPLSAQTTIYVERFEEIHTPLTPGAAKPLSSEEKLQMERWLKPDPTGLTPKELKSMANRITSGIKDPLGKARAIYEHLVVKMALSKTPAPSEQAIGSLTSVFKEMSGTSIDMAAAFVSLCRAVGVPSRTVTGIRIPAGQRQGTVNGYHGWAEFYVDRIGWIPVDPADAARDASKREYYFGSLDERRIAISKGREIILAPPQAGPPLNYLVTAYWEGDGKAMRDPSMETSFEELDDIPQRDGMPLVPKTPQ